MQGNFESKKAIREILLNKPEKLVSSWLRDELGQPLILTFYQAEQLRILLQAVFSKRRAKFIFVQATRSGKSELIACFISLVLVFFPKEKIANVSFVREQASIIFERVKIHLVEDNEWVREQVNISRSTEKHKEFSKSRLFMLNGSEFRIFSTGKGETELTGESLLGFGASILIIDESGSINNKVYHERIMRMIADSRREVFLLESGTPHRRNHFFESWLDSSYTKFRVSWEDAAKAGQLDRDFILERKANLSKTQFEAWYEAKFPSKSEGSLHDMEDVERNVLKGPVYSFEEIVNKPELVEFKGKRILSIDPATSGIDLTVITGIDLVDGVYCQRFIVTEQVSKTTGITGKIIKLNQLYNFESIILDSIGIGQGVLHELQEQKQKVSPFISGSSKGLKDKDKRAYLNWKAKVHDKTRLLFEQGGLKILPHKEQLKELSLMQYELTSQGKMKIVDPEKSPDFADALAYALYSVPVGFAVLPPPKQKLGYGIGFASTNL